MSNIGHWNDVSILPTPGIPLLVILDDLSECKSIRPAYIKRRDDDDLGYVDIHGIPLYTVLRWRYD